MVLYLLLLGVLFIWILPFPITEPRLLWMVLGERLSDGFIQNRNIIDDTGPLSAGLFALIHFLLGRSELTYELLGRILVLFQVIYWNHTLIRYRVFEENTYLPAIIMAALFHLSFDMVGLTPALLGSTFLMLALGQLFSQTLLQQDTSESTLLIGIYGGLATGFHLNFVVFLPYMIVAGIAISGFSFRQLLLSLVGFFLPILLILVFYYWNDGLKEALEIWPLVFTYEKYRYRPLLSWLLTLAFPALLAGLGYFFSTILKGSSINQQKQRQLIIIWLIFSLLEFYLVKRQAMYQLVIFIPGLTYLITSFFLHAKRSIFGKTGFWLLLVGVPAAGWWYWQMDSSAERAYFVQAPATPLANPQATIMVLGSDTGHFLDHSLGGPFLNYKLSKSYLSQEKSLEQKAEIYRNLRTQKPQIVIDEEGVFAQLLEELPLLYVIYQESSPGIFILKSR